MSSDYRNDVKVHDIVIVTIRERVTSVGRDDIGVGAHDLRRDDIVAVTVENDDRHLCRDPARAALADIPTTDLIDQVIVLTHRIHTATTDGDTDTADRLRALRAAARTEILHRSTP